MGGPMRGCHEPASWPSAIWRPSDSVPGSRAWVRMRDAECVMRNPYWATDITSFTRGKRHHIVHPPEEHPLNRVRLSRFLTRRTRTGRGRKKGSNRALAYKCPPQTPGRPWREQCFLPRPSIEESVQQGAPIGRGVNDVPSAPGGERCDVGCPLNPRQIRNSKFK